MINELEKCYSCDHYLQDRDPTKPFCTQDDCYKDAGFPDYKKTNTKFNPADRKVDWLDSMIRYDETHDVSLNMPVIDFIANIHFNPCTEIGVRTVEELFTQGYCYQFAKMVKDLFGGSIVWHIGYVHILWMDTDTQMLYDINGPFGIANTDDNYIITEEDADRICPFIMDGFRNDPLKSKIAIQYCVTHKQEILDLLMKNGYTLNPVE